MEKLSKTITKKHSKKNSNKGTITSKFGTSGRINHNSRPFYESNLYSSAYRENTKDIVENEVPKTVLNKIFCKSSENMEELVNNSIHLLITSPPYNVGKEYDKDYSLEDYLLFLKKIWKESYRVLAPGGRICINVANLGRKPYIPLHSYIIKDMLELGYLMRGEIIWCKGSSSSPSTAWGSWLSASNPTLRDTHEYILIFSKDSYSRKRENKINTITRDEFLEYTKSIWNFNAVSARKIGHPAPFPIDLPMRLLQLYSFKGDVVLDPFMGSGQTALAALKAERNFVGYDSEREYVELANKRIDQYLASNLSLKFET